jgi:hypothetical protein
MILAILICLKASFQLSAVLIFSLNPRDRTAVKSLLQVKVEMHQDRPQEHPLILLIDTCL